MKESGLTMTGRFQKAGAILFGAVAAGAAILMPQLYSGRESDSAVEMQTKLDAVEELAVELTVLEHLLRGERDRILRWKGRISVNVFEATPGDKAFIEAALGEINEATSAGDATFVLSQDEESLVRIAFVPRQYWVEVLTEEEIAEYGEAKGLTKLFGDGDIDYGIVLIDYDLPGRIRRGVILHELLHLAGVAGHDPVNPASAIKLVDEVSEVVDEFSDSDLEVVRFLYSFLRPGDGPDELHRALIAHWDHAFWGSRELRSTDILQWLVQP